MVLTAIVEDLAGERIDEKETCVRGWLANVNILIGQDFDEFLFRQSGAAFLLTLRR